MKKTIKATIAAAAVIATACSTDAPAPFGPVPSPSQVAWQKMETNMFVHFGPNTFTAAEWGDGTEAEDIFNPTDLNCMQWAQTAEKAGFGGIIITAKHHEGFAMFQSNADKFNICDGTELKRDLMKELAEKRRASQPLEYPSAGSTFKRPEGYFAGKLIEDEELREQIKGAGIGTSATRAGILSKLENNKYIGSY